MDDDDGRKMVTIPHMTSAKNRNIHKSLSKVCICKMNLDYTYVLLDFNT